MPGHTYANVRQPPISTINLAQARLLLQSRRGNRLFELGLSEIALAFAAASSKTDQLRIAEISGTHGASAFAAEWLRHRGCAWAVELLPPPRQQELPL